MIKIMCCPNKNECYIYITKDIIFRNGYAEFDSKNSGHVIVKIDRIKHIQEFKNIIEEDKLEELANSETYNYISEKCKLNNNMFNELLDSREHGFYDGFVSGYRKAKSEQLI